MSSPRWLPPTLWAAFILILTSIPGSDIPASPFSGADKIVHLTLYGVMGWLMMRAWSDRSRSISAALSALVLIALFGALDEWHQQYIPLRSMDFLDWAAGTTGAAFGVAISLLGHLRQVRA